ncbi:MAG: hypothetical protein KF891_23560 [Rhizobacter sp.]|nr:hypothetical protein [Rhizobacter sp.]
MTTDHLRATLDDQPCEVYFFKSWTSYAHPVTPVDPMYLEDALQRGKYQRAWMCRAQGEPRFMQIETIASQARPVALPEGAPAAGPAARFFEARGSVEHPQLGRPLQPDDLAAAETFIAVLPEAAASQPLWVAQKVQASFRYRYRDNGALESVTITNPEGKVNVLDY